MKKLLLLLLFLPSLINGQKKDTIVLSSIDSSVLISINNQGYKLFKKSNCYNKKEDYFSIPKFFVHSSIPLEELKFDDPHILLSNLFLRRSRKKKLSTEIYWNFFLTRNNYIESSSDFKYFYCYTLDQMFMNIRDSNKLNLDHLKYIFQIYSVDGFVSFLVTKNKKIFVHFYREEKIITLSDFNELYKNREIEGFKDNPFKG